MVSTGFEYVGFKSEINTGVGEEDHAGMLPPAIKLETLEFLTDNREAKCGYIFISSYGKYIFICEFCNERFENMENFGEHLQSNHLNNGLKGMCTQLSERVTELQIKPDISKTEGGNIEDTVSVSNEDNVSSYSPNCDDSESEDMYEEKKVNLVGGRPKTDSSSTLYCTICKRSLKTKKAFDRHNERHQNNTLKSARQSKDPATNRQTKPELIYCEICTRNFKTLKDFKDHSEKEHGDEIPLVLRTDPLYLRCIFCYQEFKKVTERLTHEKIHSEERPYRCLLCPRRFLLGQHRDLHDRTHGEQHPLKYNLKPTPRIKSKMNKELPCEYCGKIFQDNKKRRYHIRIHTQEKPFQCEECGKSFRMSDQLSRHRKRHFGIKDFVCTACGKMFFTQKALSEHEAMHSSERPFKCNVCGKAFPRKKALQVHEQLHSDVKRYECTACGMRFAQCAGLHSHRKIHHGNVFK